MSTRSHGSKRQAPIANGAAEASHSSGCAAVATALRSTRYTSFLVTCIVGLPLLSIAVFMIEPLDVSTTHTSHPHPIEPLTCVLLLHAHAPPALSAHSSPTTQQLRLHTQAPLPSPLPPPLWLASHWGCSCLLWSSSVRHVPRADERSRLQLGLWLVCSTCWATQRLWWSLVYVQTQQACKERWRVAGVAGPQLTCTVHTHAACRCLWNGAKSCLATCGPTFSGVALASRGLILHP